MRPRGVIVPMVTPMHADGSVDETAAIALATWLASCGVDGLMLAGTSGEGHALAAEDLRTLTGAVLPAWRGAGGGLLAVAVSGPSTVATVERAHAVRDLGIDAVVATPPYFFRYSVAELVAHYAGLGVIGIPVLAYDTPRYTGNPFDRTLLQALAAMDHVVGLKMSAGDLALVEAACALDASTGTLAVAQGDEDRLVAGLLAGAAAIIPGVGNVAPKACVALFRSVLAGKIVEAEQLQADLRRLGTMHAIRRGVITTKAALHLLGRCPPFASAPFLPLDVHELEALRLLLGEVDDLVRDG